MHPFSHQGATIFITFTVGFYVTLMNSPGVMCLTKGPISNSSLSCFHLEIKFKVMTSRFKGQKLISSAVLTYASSCPSAPPTVNWGYFSKVRNLVTPTNNIGQIAYSSFLLASPNTCRSFTQWKSINLFLPQMQMAGRDFPPLLFW